MGRFLHLKKWSRQCTQCIESLKARVQTVFETRFNMTQMIYDVIADARTKICVTNTIQLGQLHGELNVYKV